ncbi:MAG: EAL domain-containing protein [Paucibacter sp.]|nr:EAL domain-containing protein [Roseateles sp.]
MSIAAFAELQREVLEAVALGRSLRAVMELLCRRFEALAPGAMCTVLSVDEAGRVHPLAAPSMPKAFSLALEGLPVGPKAGSCGTAAWRGEPVEVSDITSDPLWDDYRGLAMSFGLAACWSSPVFDGNGRVAMTFALYYRQPQAVEPLHRELVEGSLQLCRVALRHDEHERRIERLAYYDSVTGLPNRSLFADRARQALHMASELGAHGALLLLDLDRFKTLNDSLGHARGDEVLRELAQRLQVPLRAADTIARFGGDEFVVLLPGCGAVDAQHVAEKLHAAIAPVVRVAHLDLKISASIGIAIYPADGLELDALLKSAEMAMYEAKRAGRNCTRYFLKAMNSELEKRLSIEAGLRHALTQPGALSVHYQPKVALNSGALCGAEALLRWHDPELGLVPPDRFIPVAEDCGLIRPLDAWVLEQACAQLASWRAAGLAVPNIAINVSPPRFCHDDVAEHVSELLLRHGLSAGDLTLEITERLMLDDNEHASAQLRTLHGMGVRLSVDDFGTGYSSLSYLRRLPVCELKLDRSFVRDIEHDPEDLALARAAIGIGRTLGMAVVAEGVETEAQRALLLDAGCPGAQGWLYAKALSADAFAQWVRERAGAPATQDAAGASVIEGEDGLN